jgi:hypothetical protein
MPCGDGVITRRQVGQTEFAVLPRDGKVACFHDHELALHPRVEIAFYGNEFFLVICVRESGRCRWLDSIPFAIHFCHGMNVVRDGIAVGDFDLLASLDRENVSGVMATLLIKRHRAGLTCGRFCFTGRYIYHDIRERITGASH